MVDTQRDGRDGRPNVGSAERPDRAAPPEGGGRVPWRVEGARRDGGEGPQRPRLSGPRFGCMLLVLLALNWILSALLVRPPERTEVPYTFFRTQVEAGNVASVTSIGDTIEGQFKNPVRVPWTTRTPGGDPVHHPAALVRRRRQPVRAAAEHNVEVNAKPPPGPPLLEQLLLGFGPTLLLVGLFVLLARRAPAAGGRRASAASAGPGPSCYQPETGQRTTFADVAGIDEVEEELAEIVDFLRNPERYRRLGAQIPKGVLLSGPPGTGKTLLARAVAGEAEVPFFSMSASEFIEMIVGVGASRVRDLFDQAKKVAPAIIFIDELDAIGRARGGAQSLGGHDEREQTLNQILTEMDGFTGTEGVIVLAATNRPEILDPALLRPGRFDRRVTVSPPDLAGRRQILEVHTRGVPLAADVDLDGDRRGHPGHGRRRPEEPGQRGGAAGRPPQPRAVQPGRLHRRAGEDRARHRARGIMLSPGGAGAHRVPRVRPRPARHADPRRRPGPQDLDHPARPGARRHLPEPRRRPLRLHAPATCGAGSSARWAAGPPRRSSTATSPPAPRTTSSRSRGIARQMVGRWGMSEAIGPVTVLPRPGSESPLGLGGDGAVAATQELVDAEVRRIVDECYAEALDTAAGQPGPARRPGRRPARAPRRWTRPTPTAPPASPPRPSPTCPPRPPTSPPLVSCA